MPLDTVAILSPGDMGHSVGQTLREGGLRVITCLEGRSERTRQLAATAGIEAIASYEELVGQAELILSIVVPAQAVALAERVAAAARTAGSDPIYMDCNAIAPQTAQRIEQIMAVAGMRFVDAGIIGGPPRGGARNRIYVSGCHAGAVLPLNQHGLTVIDLRGSVGQASALKMCYAALTKGFTALCTELLTAAEALEISEPLAAELRASQSGIYERMRRAVPGMPSKAHRWVGEMEEIAATFAALGLTPDILHGAAEMYRLVAATPLAQRTPEDTAPPPTLEEVIATLAKAL